MFSILAKRRLRWPGHVARMENGRIPKDMLYGEVAMLLSVSERDRVDVMALGGSKISIM